MEKRIPYVQTQFNVFAKVFQLLCYPEPSPASACGVQIGEFSLWVAHKIHTSGHAWETAERAWYSRERVPCFMDKTLRLFAFQNCTMCHA